MDGSWNTHKISYQKWRDCFAKRKYEPMAWLGIHEKLIAGGDEGEKTKLESVAEQTNVRYNKSFLERSFVEN